ncbi:MAG: hypothetical protein AABY53_07160 [Bdellovibrionota bacterium]
MRNTNKILFIIVALLIGLSSQAQEAETNEQEENFDSQMTGPDDRISISGAIFKRDHTIREMGEAYRDPSGLIWGSPALDKPERSGYRAAINLRQYKAKAYCKSIGARLPTRAEVNRLAIYLGRNTQYGFSPYIVNTKEGLLPGFPYSTFWTSDEYKGKNVGLFDTAHYAFDAIEFNEGNVDLVITYKAGPFGNIWGNNGLAEARCVR